MVKDFSLISTNEIYSLQDLKFCNHSLLYDYALLKIPKNIKLNFLFPVSKLYELAFFKWTTKMLFCIKIGRKKWLWAQVGLIQGYH